MASGWSAAEKTTLAQICAAHFVSHLHILILPAAIPAAARSAGCFLISNSAWR
jgi:hypothetical protein